MSVTKGPWRESNSQPSDYETQLIPFGHEMGVAENQPTDGIIFISV
jgi:hypothetical protein